MKIVGMVVCLMLLATVVHAAGPTNFTWTAPTTNTNGSPLTDLAGFNVYSCTATPCTLANSTLLGSTNATTLTFAIPANTQGYAGVTAKDTAGNESVFSNTVPFDKLAPAAPSGLATQ